MIIALWILGVIALWIIGNYIWAHRKLRRYKAVLAEVTPEEVHKRAKKYQYSWIYNKKSDAPLIRAYDEILAEKKKEHGFTD